MSSRVTRTHTSCIHRSEKKMEIFIINSHFALPAHPRAPPPRTPPRTPLPPFPPSPLPPLKITYRNLNTRAPCRSHLRLFSESKYRGVRFLSYGFIYDPTFEIPRKIHQHIVVNLFLFFFVRVARDLLVLRVNRDRLEEK